MGSQEQPIGEVRMKVGSNDRAHYFVSKCSKLNPILEELKQKTFEQPDWDGDMISGPDGSLLFSNMLKFANAKRCIDVGAFTGYSALNVALSLPDDGLVIACDICLEYAQLGMPYWKKAGVDHKIDLRIAPAAETLQSLIDEGQSGSFDFVFMDADKESYVIYFELALQLLRTNGILAVDNTWWRGRVMAGEDTEAAKTIGKLVEKMASDSRVNAVMLDMGDGVTICSKN